MKWANKKQNNFNIYNAAFFLKKTKKNTCRYHYQNLNDIIYSSWDIEQNLIKLVILGHFLPFYPLKTPKIKILKNEKNLLVMSSFYTCTPKITITWCTVPEIESETGRIFCHFGLLLALLTTPFPSPPLEWSRKSKFWTQMEKMPGDIILFYIHVYNKWKSYDKWFLKFKVRQTESFVILGHFLPFQPPWQPGKSKFIIDKNTWRYYHFTHLHHKWQSCDVWFLRYGRWETKFFVILDSFLPF